jgi:recombination protein RecT
MGLDTSHECWHGAYSAFSRWRNQVAVSAGYQLMNPTPDEINEGALPSLQYPMIEWSGVVEKNFMGEWDRMPPDPLIVLIVHSDCDGVIHPDHAGPLAARLAEIPAEPAGGRGGRPYRPLAEQDPAVHRRAARGRPRRRGRGVRMTETVTQAVAKRESSPAALIAKYSGDFARVLPTHIKPETWVRLAEGALRKGKRIDAPNPKSGDHANHGRFELEVAAANNPGVFLASLLDAARLGLEPGTETYYLTPRKVKGRLEILGIVGYQGYIELMYRAGAVSSVVVKAVRANDEYEFSAGQLDMQHPPRWLGPQEVPYHKHPAFARDAVRGDLIGVYAYARMKDGAVSQVVELDADDIARIRKVNPASNSEYSPWVNWEESMWLKSAARQLRKWVPTSAEYIREQARAMAEAKRVTEERDLPPAPIDVDVFDGEVVDAEDWPETAVPGGEE